MRALVLLSLAFLVVLLLPQMFDLPARGVLLLDSVEWMVWAAFGTELVFNTDANIEAVMPELDRLEAKVDDLLNERSARS